MIESLWVIKTCCKTAISICRVAPQIIHSNIISHQMNYANNQKYDMYAVHQDSGSLDVMIVVIVDELAPELIKRNAIGYKSASQLLTA
ncbi:ISEc21 transposase [Escherichia coli]|uniref:Uncharacterized protein n=1 Tax=Escherichia coli TaxID=562 RepID=A0A2A2BLL2_ECOLX|nr:hypothetical protein BTQ06_28865 [Escherichia coli]UQY79707.1 hypothetical protein JI426_005496 [Escherichia coli O22:H8]GCJ64394.1 ISEc21 transposase [Escherichia coli]GCJ73614.1 ISEc21 transposase [Escherichia coli]GCR06691.1 ISEc21 transposase [Escherichia coli]